MAQVNITELRKNLPGDLKRVGKGEELSITSHGKVVARIVPEQDPQALATARLKKTAWHGDLRRHSCTT